jgi:hypothetical protein
MERRSGYRDLFRSGFFGIENGVGSFYESDQFIDLAERIIDSLFSELSVIQQGLCFFLTILDARSPEAIVFHL